MGERSGATVIAAIATICAIILHTHAGHQCPSEASVGIVVVAHERTRILARALRALERSLELRTDTKLSAAVYVSIDAGKKLERYVAQR